MNKKLSITIPTYNRAVILYENFKAMLPEISLYSIPVYISDDSSTNEIEELVRKLKIEYTHIYYSRNNPSLGHDHNCMQALSLTNEDYVWLLGDSLLIQSGGISKVLQKIENYSYDILSVNAENRDLDLSDRIFDDCNELLRELGWHLTLTGATIYSRKVLSAIKDLDFALCKNFPQGSLIFRSMANSGTQFFWLNDKMISAHKGRKSYWSDNVLNVFLRDWDFFVRNLPIVYTEKSKLIAIKKHSLLTNLFTFSKFAGYRMRGLLNLPVFFQFYGELRRADTVSMPILFILSLTPKVLVKLIYETRSLNRALLQNKK